MKEARTTRMPIQWDRREFIQAGMLLAAVSALPDTLCAKALPSSMPPATFYRRLRGPIVSIPTPFLKDFQLDLKGLKNIIELGLHNGITIFDLTAGDSQFAFLSYAEIKDVARWTTETVGSRGMTIVGTNGWWLERTVEFGKFAQSIGATALQVLKPNGGDDDDLVEYYREVAKNISLPIVLHGNFPLPLLARLAEIESIVALKEDVSLAYYVNGIIRFGRRINCFSGGGLDWFLVGQPYGATAYFDSYATFAPEISVRFWHAVQAANFKEEVEVIEKYDHPFIQNFSASFWHATLEYFGVAQRYLRPPQHSYSDAEMAQVKMFYDKLGVIPKKQLF
jgi:dihydrodipicolinate synthase/N-acetylneuraminate lyase